ncbi:MAG: hypothetical protein CMJ25_16235 [Phycisphaerae bacterium]|nr:hypothetical protein [Phycisphaerae bacterium]
MGWKYEKGVDLRVSLPGTDYVLQREYTNGPIMQGGSSAIPWHLGRGWQTTAQSWIVYDHDFIVDPNMTLFEQIDGLQVHNYPVAGSTQFYPDLTNPSVPVFRSGGGGSTTVHVETITDYVDPQTGDDVGALQVLVQRTAGAGIRAYYFHNEYPIGNEPIAPLSEYLDGCILFEEDAHGNRWTYRYFFANVSDNGQPTVHKMPVLDKILLQGRDIFESTVWLEFVWSMGGSAAQPGDGHLMGTEVHRKFFDGSEYRDIVTDKVVYKTGGDTGLMSINHLINAPIPTTAGISTSGDNLVQVEIYNAIDLPVEGDSIPSGYEPEMATKIVQYRYTGYGLIRNADGTNQAVGEVLSYEFGPSTFEWLAENATDSSVIDVSTAANFFIQKGVNETIGIGGSDSVKPVDFADSVVEYYDAYPMLGQVRRQWSRSGSGRGLTTMLEYGYARGYVQNWNPYNAGNDFDSFDQILMPRRYATRIREFTRPGNRLGSLTIAYPYDDEFLGDTDWTHNKTTYHWSEDVIMHEYAVLGSYPDPDGGETLLPFLRRYRSPVTVATAIMEPGWMPQSTGTEPRAWFTFTKFSNEFDPYDNSLPNDGYWIRENGQQLQLLHPSALGEPSLIQEADEINPLYSSDPAENDIPYLLDYGSGDYVQGSTGFMAATSSGGGFSDRWEYDDLNRLIKTYEERVIGIDLSSGSLTIGQSHLIEERDYLTDTDKPGYRTDLVKTITSYRDPGGSTHANDIGVVEYEYEFEAIASQTDDRVIGIKTIAERAIQDENGPGGLVNSYVAYDEHGDTQWSLSPDEILTTYENDQSTGVTTKSETGASSVSSNPWASISFATVSEPYISESVFDIAGTNLLSRDASGIETRRFYFYDEIFGGTPGVKYLGQVSVPHFWDDEGAQKLAGPVSVEWMSVDGRTIAVRDYTPDTASDLTTEPSGVLKRTPLLTQLGDSSSYRLESQFAQLYDINNFTTSYREWYDLGSGQSGISDPYYEYFYEYDALGRSTKTTFPDGTIEETTGYDVENRPLGVKQGNSSGMNTVMEYFYDSGETPEQGIGRGLLSWTVVYPGDGTARSTRNVYDWRQRQIMSAPPLGSTAGTYPTWSHASVEGPIQVVRYDNLGRVIESATWDGLTESLFVSLVNGTATDLSTSGSSVNALSRMQTFYSQEGAVYRTATAIDPESSASDNWLVSNAWYDIAGRTLTLAPAGGAVQKNIYDTLGRLTQSLVTNGESIKGATPAGIDQEPIAYATAINAADATEEILKRTTYTYFGDDAPDPIGSRHQLGMTEVALRTHEETGSGLGTNPISTFSGSVYDPAGRAIAGVNFGTNLANAQSGDNIFKSGGATPSLMVSVPDRELNEDTMIITETEYNARGLVEAMIDPLGRRTEMRYDPLGRAYATIQNATGAVSIAWNGTYSEWEVATRPSTVRDENRVVSSVFDSNGNQVKQTAHKFDPLTLAESTQTTEYIYDAPVGQLTDSRMTQGTMKLGGLLYETRYPDPANGQPSMAAADTIRFAYSWLGEQVRLEDQNGTQREFRFDDRGRVTHELVDVLGSANIDDGVLQHRTSYDEFGRVNEVASYDAITIDGSGEQLVNKVAYTYDSRGDLTQLDQEMSGGVTKTLKWAYDYSDYQVANGNRKRLTHIEYPDGTKYLPDFGVATETDSLISRIAGYKIDDGTVSPLIAYEHLGPSTVAIADHIKGDFQMDRTVNAAGERHFGSVSNNPGQYAGWDRYGRLQSQGWVRSDSKSVSDAPDRAELFKEDYSWNRIGNLTSRINTRMFAAAPDRDWDIRYDKLNRVVDARRGIADSSLEITTLADGSQTWGLDELGNWEDTDVQGGSDQTRTHNESNEITGITVTSGAGGRSIGYDNNGNLTQVDLDTDGVSGYDTTTGFVYDAWNRLVRVTKDGSVHVEFEYNPLHWRVSKRINTDYVTDTGSSPSFEDVRVRTYSPSWQMLEEEFETDGTNSVPERADSYFWGKRASDEILSKRKIFDPDGTPSTPQWWHYVTDHLFSVRAVIAGGNHDVVHERIEYDAYGRPKVFLGGDTDDDGDFDFFDNSAFIAWYGAGDLRADLNGDGALNFFDVSAFQAMYNAQAYGLSLTDANAVSGPDNVIGYAGYHWDEELGMWLSRHRVYDPELGRWMQRDPAGYIDGMSLYAYVRGNPFTLYDPTGLKGTIVGNFFSDIYGAVKAGGAKEVVGGYAKGLGQGIGNTIDAVVVEPIKAGADIVGGIAQVATGDGDKTVLGQLTVRAIEEGLGEVTADLGNAVVDGLVETGKGLIEGDPEAYTNLGATLLPTAALNKAKKVSNVMDAVTPDVPTRTRLPQDVNVNPVPPRALDTNRPIGTSPTQNAAAQAEVQRMIDNGFTDIRVNQQQINGSGERVGINRPDVSGTNPAGVRENVEFDRTSSNRGPQHEERILANDPDAIVDLRTVD